MLQFLQFDRDTEGENGMRPIGVCFFIGAILYAGSFINSLEITVQVALAVGGIVLAAASAALGFIGEYFYIKKHASAVETPFGFSRSILYVLAFESFDIGYRLLEENGWIFSITGASISLTLLIWWSYYAGSIERDRRRKCKIRP